MVDTRKAYYLSIDLFSTSHPVHQVLDDVIYELDSLNRDLAIYLGMSAGTMDFYNMMEYNALYQAPFCDPAPSTSTGSGKGVNITNDVLEVPRNGSALKLDKYHAFNDIIDNYAGQASKFNINNGTLYQIEGYLNGVSGRFEWIIQNGAVTHRMFVPNGTITGVPIKP